MTGRWSLLHRMRAERAILCDQIRRRRGGRRIGLVQTRSASGHGTTTTQAGQENERLRSLGGCWTCFLLSLVGAGQLLPGGSATSNTVGTPMAADETLSAGRVSIIGIYGQEATTPATASAAFLVRWLYR